MDNENLDQNWIVMHLQFFKDWVKADLTFKITQVYSFHDGQFDNDQEGQGRKELIRKNIHLF